FGSRSRARIDPGESFARLDVAHVGIGVSNAAQVWGPARLQPLTLSGQAGGFPHAFLEATGAPIGIGRLNVRWIAGQLEASVIGVGLDSLGWAHRTAITLEAVNARMTHLSRVREQAPPYVHSRIIEGHTQRGLLLGSWMAIGGGGMQLRVNRRGPTPAAGWFFDAWVARLAKNQEGGTFDSEAAGADALAAHRYFATARARWLTGPLVG